MKEYHPGLEGYHPGLEGVIATESSISDINGEKGILSYRGYSIEDLAKKTSFEETSYLLLTGDLPSKSELDSFTQKVNASRELPNDFIKLLKNIPKSTKTMDVLQCTVSSLASFYDIEFDAESLKKGKYSGEYFIDVSAKILGSIGSIVAAWNRIKNGKDYINADAKLNYADNFLHMLNDKDDFYFYIQAGPDQKNISKEIIYNVDKKNCMDLSDLSVREILPFFSLCDAYVGNDSFMHHVTSQSQKPAIVLLINSPKAYTDYSKYYHRIIPDNATIDNINHSFLHSPNSISVEKVINKVLEIKSK